jgi:chaperonin cofactor prefoldin
MESEREGDLSEGLRQWLTRRAEETGVDRQELLTRAVAAYRLLEADGEELAAFDDAEERLAAVESRVSTLEGDLEEKVTDVRDRVVQVKREADRKAAADHDHPDLADDVDSALEAARAARDETDRLEEYVEGGFQNYEEVLEYLTETSETLDRRVVAVAKVLVDLRSRVREMEASLASTAAVEEIQADANRHGTATADCGDCERTVRIGLLGRPRCPHCEAAFDGFEPASGFFGSATLTVGTRPALAGETVDETEPPEAIFDDRGTPEPPDTDGLFDAEGADDGGDAGDDWSDPDAPTDDGRADGAATDEERPRRSEDGGGSA